jgi:Chaperone of endosialidase
MKREHIIGIAAVVTIVIIIVAARYYKSEEFAPASSMNDGNENEQFVENYGILDQILPKQSPMYVNSPMYVTGSVGINTSTPRCPLEVGNSILVDPSGKLNYGVLTNRNSIAQANVGPANYAIIANGCIYSTSEVRAASDIRMKTNVIELDCSEALNIVRKLKPSQYNYIDYMNKGTKPIYGFIAQEVEEVIDVVNKIEEFIPNIYKVGQFKDNIITLDGAHGLKQDDVVKIVYGDNNTNLESSVVNVMNDNSFKIDADIKNIDQVFVYGVKVNDFRNVSKEAIFSVSVAAIKQLDKENRELRQRLSLIEKKLGMESI